MSSAADTSNRATASTTEPRRLRVHKAVATCCIASRERPGAVVTTGEDELVCWFDLPYKDVKLVMDVGAGKEAVSSLCFKPGNEVVIFALSGKEVNSFAVHLGTGIITGGLDSKLVMWDFSLSQSRPLKVVDFGSPERNGSSNKNQCFNPAFVHTLAVPDTDKLNRLDKICMVARGDGAVDVIYIESELATIKENNTTKSCKAPQSTKTHGVFQQLPTEIPLVEGIPLLFLAWRFRSSMRGGSS